MRDLNKIFLFRMTHIDNIPHIIRHGITHTTSPNANKKYVPIGDGSLIKTRNNFILDNNRTLGEYIPFYFGVRTPMLYVIQKGYNMVQPTSAENIVYCVSSVQKIIELKQEYIFTNGHAVDRFSTQHSMNEISSIERIIDWSAIHAKYWRDDNDLDIKRRKEAEFLILGDVPASSIVGYIVSNEETKRKMIDFGIDEMNIQVKPDYYF